ncbi:MAG: VWA domain-containing protein [Candidatus Kerfeldbacteria bacterium]|nr:VWA domain-containing protein [Candidatus Kerfeldbacteria bacterium]
MNTHIRPGHQDQRGNITLMTVFMTGMVAFLLVIADNAKAVKEGALAQSDATTEQAFYAAQSCLEDGYLQLRFHNDYVSPYAAGNTLAVGGSNCVLTVAADGLSGNGSLTADGTAGQSIRKVVSNYRDAGPATSRNQTAIFNILDRSGSMADDGNGCSNAAYATRTSCESNGALWGPRPFVFVKSASLSFLDRLDPSYDQTGLISYNDSVRLEAGLTTSYSTLRPIITGLSQGGYTNIGDAVRVAATQLSSVTGRTKVAILLTDGIPNRPEPEASAGTYALDQSTQAKSQGVIVITIGLGDSVNNTLLGDMASVIEGRTMYFPAPNPTELEDIYRQIANILTAYNIGQGSWTEE